MLRNIMLATDFSHASRAALKASISLCRRLNGITLHVVHVLPIMSGRLKTVRQEIAERNMRSFFQRRLYPNSTTNILFSNSIAAELLRYAKQQTCGLIVVASKDRSAIGDLLTASVARKLIKQSTVPILIASGSVPKRRGYNIDKILVPFDFSNLSKKAFAFAAQLATVLNAKSHVLFVLDTRIALYSAQQKSLLKKVDARLKRFVASSASESKLRDSEVKVVVLSGNPIEEICRYARKNRIDLIVMGTNRRKTGIPGLASSTASKIISKTRIPQVILSQVTRNV